MPDLEFFELPLVLKGPGRGGVKDVIQRTVVVSHEATSAEDGGENYWELISG